MSDEEDILVPEGHQRLEAMQVLLEEILEIEQEKNHSEEVLGRVNEIVKESSKLVENSEAPNEMVIDGRILQIGTSLVRSNILNLNTNLIRFDTNQYCIGILEYLNDSMLDWDNLSRITSSMFKKTSTITYMFGTFELDAPPKHRKKPERHKKGTVAEKKYLETCETEDATEEEMEVYDHILKCFVKEYKKKNRTPINYYYFVIDPTCYWQSVENIFHFSFLVRDAKVKLLLDDRGIPLVEPEDRKIEGSQVGQKNNNQFTMKLSKEEWQCFIKIFNILSAAISPFNKS